MKRLVISILLTIVSFNAYCDFDFWGIFNTQLEVKVVDIHGNAVGGAKISLYASQADYLKEKNPVTEAEFTDKDGLALFYKLEPKVYFVTVRKDKKTNSGHNAKINKLSEGDKNKIIVVIQ